MQFISQYFKKFRISIYPKNTQNCFNYYSATKYRSEPVLYSKRTAGYPLSPHIKTIVVAFYQPSNKAMKMLNFINSENTQFRKFHSKYLSCTGECHIFDTFILITGCPTKLFYAFPFAISWLIVH